MRWPLPSTRSGHAYAIYGGTPTDLPDLALLLSVAILGFVVTNLLDLAVLLYLVTVVVLGWIVVNRQ